MTTVVASILGGPRVCYVMAQDHLLPPGLAHVNAYGTPVYALAITAVPTMAMAACMEFGSLAEVCSAGALCSFSLVCAALTLLRAPCEDGSDRGAAFPPEPDAQVYGHEAPKGYGLEVLEEFELDDATGAIAGECGDDDLTAAVPATSPGGLPAGRGNPQLPSPVGYALLVYSVLCLSTWLLLKVPVNEESRARFILKFATFGTATGAGLAALRVCRPFLRHWRRTSTDTVAAEQAKESGFRVPWMPLPALMGILMNTFLLSGIAFRSLVRAFLIDLVGVALYFLYAAPRSRLNDQQAISLVES